MELTRTDYKIIHARGRGFYGEEEGTRNYFWLMRGGHEKKNYEKRGDMKF